MLNAIVDAALRYKVLVLVAFAVLVGLGVMAFRQVPVDAFPDVTPAQVNIYTESPGVAAEDIERLLTVPIEGAMAGLPDVDVVRSVSLFGLSYVGVYFKDDVDIYFARRLVGEKLQEVKERLPQGYGEPVLGPNSSGLGQVFWYTIEVAGEKREAISLPADAIVLMQGQPTVFVLEHGNYEMRVVEPGERIGNRTVVKAGIEAGEQVVTTGAYALKARKLKSQLGHGH